MLNTLKKHQSLIASCIIVLAACWISVLLWEHAQDIQHYLQSMDAFRISVAMIYALAALFVFAYVFTIIVRQVSQKELSFSNIITPYFSAQIARYLPGKVWGVFYQAQKMSRQVSPACIWQANLELMIFGTIQHGIVILSLLAWFLFDLGYAILTSVFLELGFFIFLKTGLVHQGVLLLVRIFSPRAPVYSYINKKGGGRSALLILFLLLLEWFFIIMTWHMLLPEGTTLLDTCLVAASYILAWLAGFFAFIAPNGVFIREAVFIWVGGTIGIDQGTLVYYGVLARVFFMMADIFAVMASYAFCFARSSIGKSEEGSG